MAAGIAGMIAIVMVVVVIVVAADKGDSNIGTLIIGRTIIAGIIRVIARGCATSEH
jgi:hypothetical protein